MVRLKTAEGTKEKRDSNVTFTFFPFYFAVFLIFFLYCFTLSPFLVSVFLTVLVFFFLLFFLLPKFCLIPSFYFFFSLAFCHFAVSAFTPSCLVSLFYSCFPFLFAFPSFLSLHSFIHSFTSFLLSLLFPLLLSSLTCLSLDGPAVLQLAALCHHSNVVQSTWHQAV